MSTITITEDERQLVADAQTAFSVYAARSGADSLDDLMPLAQLQVRALRWQAQALSTAADSGLQVMALGITEEACWEMVEAVENNAQDEVYDSIGDILVYTCQACTSLRLDFSTIAQSFASRLINASEGEGIPSLMRLFKAVGMFAHVAGKNAQRTRGYDDMAKVRVDGGAALSRVCAAVHWLAFNNDWDAAIVFEEVLTRVMKRNWNANKLTGQQELSL